MFNWNRQLLWSSLWSSIKSVRMRRHFFPQFYFIPYLFFIHLFIHHGLILLCFALQLFFSPLIQCSILFFLSFHSEIACIFSGFLIERFNILFISEAYKRQSVSFRIIYCHSELWKPIIISSVFVISTRLF